MICPLPQCKSEMKSRYFKMDDTTVYNCTNKKLKRSDEDGVVFEEGPCTVEIKVPGNVENAE